MRSGLSAAKLACLISPAPHDASIFPALLKNNPQVALCRRFDGRFDRIRVLVRKSCVDWTNCAWDADIFLNAKVEFRRGIPPKAYCRHLARPELDAVATENRQETGVAENHTSALQPFLCLRK